VRFNRQALRYGSAIIRIARVSESRIGKTSDDTAMTVSLSVDKILTHSHFDIGTPRPNSDNLHAHCLRALVSAMHRSRGLLGNLLPSETLNLAQTILSSRDIFNRHRWHLSIDNGDMR